MLMRFHYWGGVTYISDTLKCDVYRSLLKVDDTKITNRLDV